VLPGNSTAAFKEFPVPEPGHGQVLIKTKSSTICGSDIRAIYREHAGKRPEGYQNKIAGHEPCGQIVELGSGFATATVLSFITSPDAEFATIAAAAA
jgi:threonine dehydrogenase-like Zn-dependent dehydrogenase